MSESSAIPQEKPKREHTSVRGAFLKLHGKERWNALETGGTLKDSTEYAEAVVAHKKSNVDYDAAYKAWSEAYPEEDKRIKEETERKKQETRAKTKAKKRLHEETSGAIVSPSNEHFSAASIALLQSLDEMETELHAAVRSFKTDLYAFLNPEISGDKAEEDKMEQETSGNSESDSE